VREADDFTSGGQGERTDRPADGVDRLIDGLDLPEFGKT
jgi:hypothetical protein